VRELLPSDVELKAHAEKGAATLYRIKRAQGVPGVGIRSSTSSVLAALRKYDLIGNKHIPAAYLRNTRDVRLKVLAGILDTDGGYQNHTNQFILTQKVERLIDDVVALARSLGFACYKKEIQSKCCNNGKVGTYYTVNIVGAGIEEIPTVLPRKQARERVKAKDVRRVGFTLERVEDDNFYGFELDGNHRYLMDDYVVLHNSNSKSLYISLFEKAFGDYCIKFPITLLTQKRAASNAATPEVARSRGKRFASLQEPSEDEKLNIGLMKELSGGDRIQARGLFKEPVEFYPQFKMLLLCNHLPCVPSDDGGTWRRIRVVEFTSRFCENPRPDLPNEFPIDYELQDKLPAWREHFMALLIHYYDRYQTEGVKEPEAVLKVTREYRENNDHLARFASERLVPEADQTSSLEDILAEFLSWVKSENIPQFKAPKKIDFDKGITRVTQVKSVIKKGCGRHFKGLRLLTETTSAADESPAAGASASAAAPPTAT
jgi:P4 family phage/plasmid primase-like protien